MKKIFFLSLFFPAIFTQAQETRTRTFLDFDLGLEFIRMENSGFPVHPLALNNGRLFGGWCTSIGLYQRIEYFDPQWSIGFFAKPLFGTNMFFEHFDDEGYATLQFPFGIATEFGNTDEHSPGLMLGAAMSFNIYDFHDYNIPQFYKWMPYFFIQAHEGAYGIRFSAGPPQNISNKDGTVTNTSFDFELTLIVTAPAKK
ncbi:MAG: hypothetical protein HY064_16145 [Bacteroidetes bacterium]|nr:hypothetical protein [Bacteroidota bacterium]